MAQLKIDGTKLLAFTRAMPYDHIGMYITIAAIINENGSIPASHAISITNDDLHPILKYFDFSDGNYCRKVKPSTKPPREKKLPLLFRDCPYISVDEFIKQFSGTEYERFNLRYYHECVKNWSEAGNKFKVDWIATAKSFMTRDAKEGKAAMAGTQLLNSAGNGNRTNSMAAEMAAQFSGTTKTVQ